MTRALVGWGSSSIAGIGPALDAVLREDLVRFVNEGHGGETSHHTAARIGSLPVPISVDDGRLPEAGTVRIGPTSLDLVPHFLKPFAGQVAGVEGVVHGNEDGVYFTRARPGESVTVDGDPFFPVLGAQLQGEDTLLWMGKNDLNRGAAAREVIERTDATFDYLRTAGARVAVLGHFADIGSTPQQRKAVLAVNAAHAERYGDHYIDVHAVLTDSGIWAATGMAPTPEDEAEQAAGNKPQSISTDPGHLNLVGYGAVAARIRAALVDLSWL